MTAWHPWQLDDLEMFDATCLSGPRRRHFAHGYLMLVAYRSGSADNSYRNRHATDHCAVGRFRVFEPEEAWLCRPQAVTFQCLTIAPARLQQIAADALHHDGPVPHFPSTLLFDPAMSGAFRALAAASRAPASRLEREELIANLFARLVLEHGENAQGEPRPGIEHRAVRRAKDYLEAHYVDAVSLDTLGTLVGLSPFHLARVFRDDVGVPPHEYQTQLRLSRARALLARGLDVGHAAHATGFFDQSHFARHFQRYFFMRPSDYRKTAKRSA